MLNTFKNLVNNIEATITCEKDFEKEYGINLDDKPIHFAKDKVSKEIQTILKSIDDGLDKSVLNKINTELMYRQIIYDEDLIPYLQIIDIMHYVTGFFKFIPNWDDEKWNDLIRSSKNYLNISENYKFDLKSSNTKVFNRAQSVKYLTIKNCEIKIVEDEIEFISGLDEIYKKLEQKISEFGGINLIFECLAHIDYDSKFKRYIFLKDLNPGDKEPQIPWGYLLNLSLKHLQFKHISKRFKYEKLFKEIIELSTRIINGVYNVQDYSIWPYFYLGLKNLPQHVSNMVLYDSLFTIPQSNILLELELCKYLFSFDYDFFKDNLGFTIDEFVTVGKDFYNIWNKENKPILIQLSKKANYTLSYDTYIKILNFMSHTNNLNNNYIEPDDYQKINFPEKPLLKFNSSSFLLPAVSWSAPNFYESLASFLREPCELQLNKNLNDILGVRLEEFIAILLNKYGINFIKGGKYKFNKNNAECDFVIECEKSIIIIEVKKKVLTRESKSGRNYSIIIDLSKSLLYSQIQAGKVEILLKRNGKISLKENNTRHEILLKNRVIKRISLTQLEYGSLYNQLFIRKFLEAQLNGEFRLENGDDELNKKFEEFIRYGEQFQHQYIELNNLQEEDFNHFIHRCYFMSLSQLFEVIKRSSDNETFDENLPKNLIETGAFDWYYEYGILNK